jgi:alanyl-tRNA synthetase
MSNPTPTMRLYYDDSYLTQFEAGVLEQAQGGLRVYLDRTAFYPTSGGQPFDTGWFEAPGSGEKVEVVDVIDEGERVAHVLATPFLGARVTGHVHFARRFDHMQQHSGQHLLSAVFQELTGLVTIGVHFGDVSSTLDLEGTPTSQQLQAVEARANALVFENRPVSAAIEEQAEGLRKASTREGPLRIVSIGELDRSACGGTHVRATGEIGPVLLRRLERVRKATRVEFVCGVRAVQRARADQEALSQLGALLSTGLDQVPQIVSTRLAELKETSSALREARTALAGYRAHELYRSAAPAAGAGLRWHIERQASISVEELRGVAQAYSALPRAVFVGASDSPAQVLLATSEDSGLHAGNSLKAALTAAQGKGGGSPRLAQGSVSDRAALERVLEELSLLRSKVQGS